MKNLSKRNSRALKAVLLLSSLSFIHMAYAQEAERRWGEADATSKASASDRVAHFKSNLTPHASSRYGQDAYHKTIVKLNWFDQGQSRSAFVNLKRTFDIYSLFEGSSLLLSPRAKAILDDLGEAIISEGINTRMYAIAGHSVIKGDMKADQQLSVSRAKTVRDYLKQKFDISDQRLRPVGFGSFNPKDKENLTSSKNNRIELCLIEDLYQRTPTTKIQLPDVNSRTNEGIMITTAGQKPAADKMKLAEKKPAHKALAYARHTGSQPALPAAKKAKETMKTSSKKMAQMEHKQMAHAAPFPASKNLVEADKKPALVGNYQITSSAYGSKAYRADQQHKVQKTQARRAENRRADTRQAYDEDRRAPRRGSHERTYRTYDAGYTGAYDDRSYGAYDDGAYDDRAYDDQGYDSRAYDDRAYGYGSSYGGSTPRCE